MEARWPDGWTHAIADVTVGEFRLWKKGPQRAQAAKFAEKLKEKEVPPKKAKKAAPLNILWMGVQAKTGHRVSVGLRKDRKLKTGGHVRLCSIFLKSDKMRQLCQLPLHTCKNETEEAKVKGIMVKLAKEFANGQVTAKNLKTRRDVLVAEDKGTQEKASKSEETQKEPKKEKRQPTMKRPAASQPSTLPKDWMLHRF